MSGLYDTVEVGKDLLLPPKVNGRSTRGLKVSEPGRYWSRKDFTGISLMRAKSPWRIVSWADEEIKAIQESLPPEPTAKKSKQTKGRKK